MSVVRSYPKNPAESNANLTEGPETHQEPPRGNMQRASHVSSTTISILLSGHKGPRLSSPPRVLKLLSDGTHPDRPCDGQPADTSIHYTDKTACHLAQRRGRKV